jgi:hemolysin III
MLRPNFLSRLPVAADAAAMPAAPRAQCWQEEWANAASHGAGALLAAGCSPWAIAKAMAVGALQGAGALVFCVTMVLLFTVSCIYHAARDHSWKRLLQRLDHAAIFLFIAGTYTPFLLGVLADNGGPWVLAGVWFMALLGVGAKLTDRIRHPLLSTLLYVGMGWMAAFMLGPLAREIPPAGVALIVAGGLLYTVGAVVFHFDDRIRFGHLLWHVLVLAACACHFLAVAHFSV